MKRIKLIAIILSGFLFSTSSKAQQGPLDANVTTEAIPLSIQSGAHNYFSIRITLDKIYDQNVTVSGYYYDEGNYNTDHPFSLTVEAGNLTFETDSRFIETDPTATAAVTVNQISPAFVTSSGATYGTQWILTGQPSTLCAIFSSLDLNVLQSGDENAIAEYLTRLNQTVINYISNNYPQFLPADSFDVNDPDAVAVGFWFALAEKNNFVPFDTTDEDITFNMMHELKDVHYALSGPNVTLSSTDNVTFKYPEWLHCIVDVTLGYFDVRHIIRNLGTMNVSSVWKAVKSAAKKYLGWIGAATLIYDVVTNCIL